MPWPWPTRTAGRCLGDNCHSAESVPVGSTQVRLGRDSSQCGLVGCSRAWWNDRQNDHLSKQRGLPHSRSGSAARPQGQSGCRTTGWGESRFDVRRAGRVASPRRLRCPQEHLRASKNALTAVQTSVFPGRSRPLGVKLGVLTMTSSTRVLGRPPSSCCLTATLRAVTASVSANGGEALWARSFSQIAASRTSVVVRSLVAA